MHGFIVGEIKGYVTGKLGAETWQELLRQAEIGRKEYENFEEYPDEEVVHLVATASKMTGLAVADILEDFGDYLGHHLLRIYRPLLRPEWRTLDFLVHIEETVHHVVRTRNRKAQPPALACTRIGPRQVLIVYRSPRRMCALARGIVRGLANHYGEEVQIAEDTCMHRGDPSCGIRVSLLG